MKRIFKNYNSHWALHCGIKGILTMERFQIEQHLHNEVRRIVPPFQRILRIFLQPANSSKHSDFVGALTLVHTFAGALTCVQTLGLCWSTYLSANFFGSTYLCANIRTLWEHLLVCNFFWSTLFSANICRSTLSNICLQTFVGALTSVQTFLGTLTSEQTFV